MSNHRLTGGEMPLDEATVSTMRENASVMKTLECKSCGRRECGNPRQVMGDAIIVSPKHSCSSMHGRSIAGSALEQRPKPQEPDPFSETGR
jgi:hypothetical protein